LAVPTNDLAVRLRLRDLGEPASCFGEANVDRRERLREVLVKERQRRLEARLAKAKGPESSQDSDEDVKSESEDEAEQEEEFFTEGDADLLQARRNMAWYSLARAKERLEKQRWEAKLPLTTVIGSRRTVFDPLRVSNATSLNAV
jgi:U4/U6 small nuclear ribonucleoprotein PRP4